MSYKVDQLAAIHERKEGELYVDWNMVRAIALKWDGRGNSRDALAGQLAQALLDKGRRIEDLDHQNSILRKALSHYADDNYNGVDKIKMFTIPDFGEAGRDLDNSPGVGDFYVKLYDGSWHTSGYDTIEDAIEELKALHEDFFGKGEKE